MYVLAAVSSAKNVKESNTMSIGQTEFRQALGHFASGVTVITTQHQGQLHGTTVSSFCSLSLRPPLILVSIDLSATIHDLIVESEIFTVNILAEHAESLSQHFAKRIPDKFSTVPYRLGQLGAPILEDALASLECHLVSRYPGGDHSIFIGEVVSASTHSHRQPLLYFRSKYGRLHDSLASLVSTNGSTKAAI
jgi:flavin reductase (DIM6/NTAB) family NADH-FMN oxidoreductase RutF